MEKVIEYLKNEKIAQVINIELNGYGQNEVLEIFIKLWNDNISTLNINIYHNSPNTNSRVKIKAVISDKVKLNITGNVFIKKGMSGSDTYFEARILSLSPQAIGSVTPSLMIDENDVKAGHAASITNISDRDLFYMQSRGLDYNKASELIEKGFLQR